MCRLNAKIITLGLFLIAVILAVTGTRPGYTAEKVIRFGIAAEGYPPYMLTKEGGSLGIAGDVIWQISADLGYPIEVVIRPKKRLEHLIKVGEIDAIAEAPEWRNDTMDFVSTDGIIDVADHVVMTIDQQKNMITVDQLKSKHVASRLGFIYPSLELMFADGTIRRTTTQSFKSLLKMVAAKRVDYGIIDVNVANWVIRKHGLKLAPELYFSKPGFDEVAFRMILFSKKWAPFVKQFNEALSKFKASKEWQKLLNRYN